MLGDLARAGFEVTPEHEDADAIVVNTCAFVEDAKSESLQAIMEAGGCHVCPVWGCTYLVCVLLHDVLVWSCCLLCLLLQT